MWNSLGSLRDRVRENAKVAAQVAQGVLQAAAAEEDEQPSTADADWDAWEPPQQPAAPPPPPPPGGPLHPPEEPLTSPKGPPPPPPAAPPPDEPPPPPADDQPAVRRPARTRGRYVVTGQLPASANVRPAAAPFLRPAAPPVHSDVPVQPDPPGDSGLGIRPDPPLPEESAGEPKADPLAWGMDEDWNVAPAETGDAALDWGAPPADAQPNGHTASPAPDESSPSSLEPKPVAVPFPRLPAAPGDEAPATQDADRGVLSDADTAERETVAQEPESKPDALSWGDAQDSAPNARPSGDWGGADDDWDVAPPLSYPVDGGADEHPFVWGDAPTVEGVGDAADWFTVGAEQAPAGEEAFPDGTTDVLEEHSGEQCEDRKGAASMPTCSPATQADGRTEPAKTKANTTTTESTVDLDPGLPVRASTLSITDSSGLVPEARAQVPVSKIVPTKRDLSPIEDDGKHATAQALNESVAQEGAQLDPDFAPPWVEDDGGEAEESGFWPTGAASNKTAPSAEAPSSTTFDFDSNNAVHVVTTRSSSVQMLDGSADVLEQLREEVRLLTHQRNSALAGKEASEKGNDDLKRTLLELKDELSSRADEVASITQEREKIRKHRDALLDEKALIEQERDAAIVQGGDGIREARNAIEVMRSSQDVAEQREAVISEQIAALRTDLERISAERNTLIEQVEELKDALTESEQQSRVQEEEVRQQLSVAQNELEIASLERERALTASQLHVQEHKELLEAEQSRVASFAAYEARIKELEGSIEAVRREREDELFRIDSFSTQMEDMKERTQSVIQERNNLHQQKLHLQKESEAEYARCEQLSRELLDARRETASVASERDEARQRFASLREQLGDLTGQLESIAAERDRLVQERSLAAASSTSISEKERSLAQECQQKTAAMVALQKKLRVAVVKIDKLTTQRTTFQRQRDEAGSRLRAAGSEFASLNGKLNSVSKDRDELQSDLLCVRDEKDKALSQVQELSEVVGQKKLVEESLEVATKHVEGLKASLEDAKENAKKLSEDKSALQQRCTALVTDLNNFQGKYEVALHEKDIWQSQKAKLEGENHLLKQSVSERESTVKEATKAQKVLEVDLTTVREKAALDIGIARAELSAEKQVRVELEDRISKLQRTASENVDTFSKIRDGLEAIVSTGKKEMETAGDALMREVLWPFVPPQSPFKGSAQKLLESFSSLEKTIVQLITLLVTAAADAESLRGERDRLTQNLTAAESKGAESAAMEHEVATAKAMVEEMGMRLELVKKEKHDVGLRCNALQESLTASDTRVAELETEVGNLARRMKDEAEESAQISAEERARLVQEIERITSSLKSIWGMVQKSLASQQIDLLSEDVGDFDEVLQSENVAVLALRATALIVAELDRNRTTAAESAQRLQTAESEVTRLVERAEIAEQERDAHRGTNERLERKAKEAREEGEEGAKKKFETLLSQLEDELEDTREELSRTSDKASKSEKEAGELRALCSKLTSQFNGRTNELDEAEEKVVYLQDQVTSLEEDLEEAHSRLKVHEAESAQARRSDVDRLSSDLAEAEAQVQKLQVDCTKLREAYDKAESDARESELLAETHRKAEENLKIAIEQLEAAQDSVVEQRTIELHKKLGEAEERCNKAKKREEMAAVTENKLGIRDDEIKELRGAIGRLADERVELKLELEKSLSRLNHPDAGGQLVDRRVVRQLLVSYFRVGSIRRRDVLELMSRMLAFSDADNVAVGLKRRALMDRLGSLVQPPELEDASLPPLGTVSDKWIEFLMNETEEGEDQSRGW